MATLKQDYTYNGTTYYFETCASQIVGDVTQSTSALSSVTATGQQIPDSVAVKNAFNNKTTVRTSDEAPSNSLGENGDVYIQTGYETENILARPGDKISLTVFPAGFLTSGQKDIMCFAKIGKVLSSNVSSVTINSMTNFRARQGSVYAIGTAEQGANVSTVGSIKLSDSDINRIKNSGIVPITITLNTAVTAATNNETICTHGVVTLTLG